MSLDDAEEFIKECNEYSKKEREVETINTDEVLEAFTQDISQVITNQTYQIWWQFSLDKCVQMSRLEPTRQFNARIKDVSLPSTITLQDTLNQSITPVIQDWLSQQRKLIPLNVQLETILDVRINDKQLFTTITLMLSEPDELRTDALLLNNTLVSEHPECVGKSVHTLVSEYGLAYDEHIITFFEYKLP